MSRLDLRGAEFAFLAACGTAAASRRLTDEAIHVTSAFQLAGFRRVVGTLWPVSDAAAAVLANRFYRSVTRRGTTSPDARLSAAALHDAVRARRDAARHDPSTWAAYLHAGA